MSETHDISETDTHTMPIIPPASELPQDFSPLIEDDPDDFAFDQAIPPAPPKRRGWIVWVSILLLVVLLGGFFTYRNLTRKPVVTYTQAAATTGNLTITVGGTGPVQAGAVYNLNFSGSAPITAINVHVGQKVKKGDVLATLDATSLQDAVNQAQNSVNAAQTSVNSASSNLSNARSQRTTSLDLATITYNEAKNACNNPTPPNPTLTGSALTDCLNKAKDNYNQAVNQANGSVTSASNQLTSSEQQLTSAKQQLQTAQNNLQNANLVAPHDGVITSVNGLVGENSNGGGGNSGSGSSGGSSGGSSAFIVLVDASTLNIAAQINEANIASVDVNQTATFTVAAYPSQTFRATVTGIDTLGATSSNVVTYQVNLAVDLQSVGDAHVYPGMTANVNITTAERISVLLVPSTALSFSTTAIQNGELSRSDLRSLLSNGSAAQGTGTGSQGIVIELKNGKLVPVLVQTGLTNGQFTEIVSGLNEGDQVVVSQTGGTTTTTGGGGNGGFPGGGRGGNGTGGSGVQIFGRGN